MFIPMPVCIVIVVLMVIVVSVMWFSLRNARADWEKHKNSLIGTIDHHWKLACDEESARFRVIHLLADVHKARHLDWKMERIVDVEVWQDLADGIVRMMPKDADILVMLDGAFPHEECEEEATDTEGTET